LPAHHSNTLVWRAQVECVQVSARTATHANTPVWGRRACTYASEAAARPSACVTVGCSAPAAVVAAGATSGGGTSGDGPSAGFISGSGDSDDEGDVAASKAAAAAALPLPALALLSRDVLLPAEGMAATALPPSAFPSPAAGGCGETGAGAGAPPLLPPPPPPRARLKACRMARRASDSRGRAAVGVGRPVCGTNAAAPGAAPLPQLLPASPAAGAGVTDVTTTSGAGAAPRTAPGARDAGTVKAAAAAGALPPLSPLAPPAARGPNVTASRRRRRDDSRNRDTGDSSTLVGDGMLRAWWARAREGRVGVAQSSEGGRRAGLTRSPHAAHPRHAPALPAHSRAGDLRLAVGVYDEPGRALCAARRP
jgi:hypothetical protein